MELLSSKEDHEDCMCDRNRWGSNFVKRLDQKISSCRTIIYHMQVQEGDIIWNIR